MKNDITEQLIWINGEIMNVCNAKINVMTPTAQFGLNVFEGIRCYWNEDENQLYAFRLDDHFKRLQKSIKLLELKSPYSELQMKQAFFDVIKESNFTQDIAVRQTVFVEGFGSWRSDEPVGMFVSPIPKAKSSAEYNKKGLNCCFSSWRRISDDVLSPRIKCGANYINSRMAQREALRNGYDTTLFLNDVGKVAEGPGSCLFMVRNGVLVTPQLTDSVLESITRDTIIKIAKDLGIEVQERSIDRTELYIADEAFLSGSAMEICAIYSVDKYALTSDHEGEITNILHKKYLEVVSGKDSNYKYWLTPIYER